MSTDFIVQYKQAVKYYIQVGPPDNRNLSCFLLIILMEMFLESVSYFSTFLNGNDQMPLHL